MNGWNYSTPGANFVTIVTDNRKKLFGEIRNNVMIKNNAGKNVEQGWTDLPIHYPNIELDEFIVMPNHVHGIIIITTKFYNQL